jgi:hypothetical protein
MVPSLRAPTAEKADVAAPATKQRERNPGETQSLQTPPKSSRGVDAPEQVAAKAMQASMKKSAKQSACLDGERRGEHDASIVGV